MPATTLKPIEPAVFAQQQLALLATEAAADATSTSAYLSTYSPRALASAGLAVLNLVVSGRRTGYGGKTVLEFERDSAVQSNKKGDTKDDSERGGGFEESGMRVGDVVGVRAMGAAGAKKTVKKDDKGKQDREVQGVVLKVTQRIISVALDKEEQEGELEAVAAGRVWLCVSDKSFTLLRLAIVEVRVVRQMMLTNSTCILQKLANEVTYKRMNQTMEKLAKLEDKDQTIFQRVMFGLTSPTPLPASLTDHLGAVEWKTERLNESQKEAIMFALASREIALIHGPPGTGKTHTLIELILQFLARGMRLLVCGPSNISVDNIVERLAPHKVPMVRLGHPARLLPSVLNHSLEMLTKTSEAAALVQDVRKEMDVKQASIRKTRTGRERKVIYGELKELRAEYRERERGCVDNLVRESKVVLATLHGAGGHQLRNTQFDVVIIDEASQALEAQCWVPLLTAKKAVLAGDHLQLPPTIKSLNSKDNKVTPAEASENGAGGGEKKKSDKDAPSLETTLFDRLLKIYGESIKRLLTIQYRMHEKIMRFASDELYEGRLTAAESVKARLLCDLPNVERTDDTIEPLIFFDTQGGDFPERAEGDDDETKPGKGLGAGESKANELEVALVAKHVATLVEQGVPPFDIAVITPYNAQVPKTPLTASADAANTDAFFLLSTSSRCCRKH